MTKLIDVLVCKGVLKDEEGDKCVGETARVAAKEVPDLIDAGIVSLPDTAAEEDLDAALSAIERQEAIVPAVEELLKIKQGLTAAGIPEVSAISKIVGFSVTAEERAAAGVTLTERAAAAEKAALAATAEETQKRKDMIIAAIKRMKENKNGLDESGNPDPEVISAIIGFPVDPEELLNIQVELEGK